jgi:guanylate kinase
MERDGVEYHFIDFATAERMLDEGAFVEAKILHNTAISGTSLAEVERAKAEHKIAINDINIEGVAEYIQHGLHPRAIFLLPPSYEVWRERLSSRYEGEIPTADLIQRLRSALREIDHALSVDYYYIVINNDLGKTVELVHQIAEGQTVEPHYHKAMSIAEDLRAHLQAELNQLT